MCTQFLKKKNAKKDLLNAFRDSSFLSPAGECKVCEEQQNGGWTKTTQNEIVIDEDKQPQKKM